MTVADECEDDAAREVVAMQFAAGAAIADLAEEWEHDAGWVEEAIRRMLLQSIPRSDGGMKPPRAEGRAERREEQEAVREAQKAFEWGQ